eukprot:scaffold647790_cov33-Prasinocladus_malaysianus.AAC.1
MVWAKAISDYQLASHTRPVGSYSYDYANRRQVDRSTTALRPLRFYGRQASGADTGVGFDRQKPAGSDYAKLAEST